MFDSRIDELTATSEVMSNQEPLEQGIYPDAVS